MGGITTDLRTGLAFCTRLPVTAPSDASLSQAAWALPIAGTLIGLIGGCVLYAALALNTPPFVAAALAIAATALATGCLHEDGLADTADGLGGGRDRVRTLEIMRDSPIGTYGVVALIISFSLRIGALASLAALGAAPAMLALVAAHAGARGALPVFMRAVPRARDDGLSASAGKPNPAIAASALGIGILISVLCVGFGTTLAAAVLAAAALVLLARISIRKIGGQTGDILGAAEQAGEIAVLVVVSAMLAR